MPSSKASSLSTGGKCLPVTPSASTNRPDNRRKPVTDTLVELWSFVKANSHQHNPLTFSFIDW
jgi:hypothetical protein